MYKIDLKQGDLMTEEEVKGRSVPLVPQQRRLRCKPS